MMSDEDFEDELKSYLSRPGLKAVPHPVTCIEAFDGGVFWEAMMLGPKLHAAHLAYFRVACLMCADKFSASYFSKLDEDEMVEEAERFGRRYLEGTVYPRAEKE